MNTNDSIMTLEQISSLFTLQRVNTPNACDNAKLDNQWPGTGAVGTPELSQLVASQGGSYLQDIQATHTTWRERPSLPAARKARPWWRCSNRRAATPSISN